MVLSDLDRELLNRCLARFDGAWEAFIDRYLALITHVVITTSQVKFSHLPDEMRDDMVAEILLALVDDDFAILRRFRGQSSLGTYLVVVSRRIAARRVTKLAPPPSLTPTDLASQPDDAAKEMTDVVENTEEVHTLLGKLASNEATAIRMFHLEHRSYGEIGQHMGIPENSVGPLLTKAREHMRSLRN